MSNTKLITGDESVYPVKGIRLSSCGAQICYKDRDDLLLIALEKGAHTAAVFTRNAFCAAPVQIARQHLNQSAAQYLIINSGNANAGTGQAGNNDALQVCQMLADQGGVQAMQVLPFSTGVIGQRLPVKRISDCFSRLLTGLAEDAWAQAAKAIMTTDTVPKLASCKIQIDNRPVHITGIAKGAGMICPDMATMLAFIATDAAIARPLLQDILNRAVNRSFNRITVDGDTSTNDSCVLMATGKAGNACITDQASPGYAAVEEAVNAVCSSLAKAIIRDGEGATRFVTLVVSGANSSRECLEVAYTVAHSPLVKTALFAGDPNWGRILAAVGRAKIDNLDVTRVSIALDQIALIKNGEPSVSYTEEQGKKVMQQNEITISIELGRGDYSETVWTTDLSHDYVTINAEYRS